MFDLLKEYGSKRLDLLKLEATEKSSLTVGMIVFFVIAFFCGLFFIILLNLGLGFLIGHYLNNYAYGVLIMAGFYLFLLIIVLLNSKFIKNLVANKIIKSLNKDEL